MNIPYLFGPCREELYSQELRDRPEDYRDWQALEDFSKMRYTSYIGEGQITFGEVVCPIPPMRKD